MITNDGAIEFNTVVKVGKLHTESEQNAQALSVLWLIKELPSLLPRRQYWQFFETATLVPDNFPKLSKIDLHKQKQYELALHPNFLLTFQEAILYLRDLEERFDQAKEKLWQFATTNLPFGFAQTRAEAHVLLRFIENVLSAGADEAGYEPFRARAAINDYDELAKRKDVENHNYKISLESLQQFACGVSFPRTWHKRPSA